MKNDYGLFQEIHLKKGLKMTGKVDMWHKVSR